MDLATIRKNAQEKLRGFCRVCPTCDGRLCAGEVLVGRPLVIGAFGNGAEGVAMLLSRMRGELEQAMLLTGSGDVKKVSAGILAP